MIDIYIDDVRVKTIGLSDGKHSIILEAKSDKENKAQILLDDEELKSLCILSKNRCEVQGLIPVYNTISGTADVEKVRHGEWIEKEHWVPLPRDYEVSYDEDYDECYDEQTHSWKAKYWHCSCCDYEASRDMEPWFDYCPKCGAKMKK